MVGVVASLAVLIGLHTLFDRTSTLDAGAVALEVPVWSSWDPLAFALTALAVVSLLVARWSVHLAGT